MVVKSYEQMTDVSIMEVKTYLLIHSDGIYQQDIYDLMNTCIDVFQLKRKLNKRKDIQLWLFSNIKRYIDKKQYIWLILIFIIEIFVLLSTRLSHY